jgi:translation initiation factor 1
MSGFDLDDKALNLLSKQLKQQCGTGGSVKDGVVIIQGNHRDTIKSLLEGQGYW